MHPTLRPPVPDGKAERTGVAEDSRRVVVTVCKNCWILVDRKDEDLFQLGFMPCASSSAIVNDR